MKIHESGVRFKIHSPHADPEKTKYYYNPDTIRFNHYKFNEKELDWVKLKLKVDLRIDKIDKDIKLLYDRLNAPGL